MWRRITLRTRIMLSLGALVGITVLGGVISIGYTSMTDAFMSSLIESDVVALHISQELENSLVMQKGYVTYFFQDRDPEWIQELEKYHTSFDVWLKKARQYTVVPEERTVLNDLEHQYIKYGAARDQVIELYRLGKTEEGFALQKNIRGQFFSIIKLCGEFHQLFQSRIEVGRLTMKRNIQLLNVVTAIGLALAIGLGIFLAYILLIDVLGPIRQLALDAPSRQSSVVVKNEVQALSERVQYLIDDVDQTKSKLKWSREHLEQAEKWALVGKLAAGVAHSVRNPLTSVKMRLFSMERSLSLSSSQKEDFEVISEEIRHIDTIVQNFLEFSRPPKLKMQKVSPSDCVDMAIQLLRHRLESYDVKVEIRREKRLPVITADPDQLKEVLVNLIVNSCEAMVDGGKIVITESESMTEQLGPTAKIEVSDNGPGAPPSVQEKIFRPFFSTKEEGTGLGLSIAQRIVEEHGGSLDLKSKEGRGATFIIALPEKETQNWV